MSRTNVRVECPHCGHAYETDWYHVDFEKSTSAVELAGPTPPPPPAVYSFLCPKCGKLFIGTKPNP